MVNPFRDPEKELGDAMSRLTGKLDYLCTGGVPRKMFQDGLVSFDQMRDLDFQISMKRTEQMQMHEYEKKQREEKEAEVNELPYLIASKSYETVFPELTSILNILKGPEKIDSHILEEYANKYGNPPRIGEECGIGRSLEDYCVPMFFQDISLYEGRINILEEKKKMYEQKGDKGRVAYTQAKIDVVKSWQAKGLQSVNMRTKMIIYGQFDKEE